LQCVAVCCGVLQCVAVCCRVLQCVAVCCRVLQCFAVCCWVLQCVAVCCSVVQRAAENTQRTLKMVLRYAKCVTRDLFMWKETYKWDIYSSKETCKRDLHTDWNKSVGTEVPQSVQKDLYTYIYIGLFSKKLVYFHIYRSLLTTTRCVPQSVKTDLYTWRDLPVKRDLYSSNQI